MGWFWVPPKLPKIVTPPMLPGWHQVQGVWVPNHAVTGLSPLTTDATWSLPQLADLQARAAAAGSMALALHDAALRFRRECFVRCAWLELFYRLPPDLRSDRLARSLAAAEFDFEFDLGQVAIKHRLPRRS